MSTRSPVEFDPRDVVTPDDLNVAPELLGTPLARPGRRLLAISVDVGVVGLLSTLGNLWLVAGLGLMALSHLRAPRADRPSRRRALRAVAAGLIAVGAFQAWQGRDPVAVPTAQRAVDIARADDDLPQGTPGLSPLQAAEARIAVLKAELAAAREPRVFDLREQLRHWTDEVGLGFGWAIAYFSLLPAWWNGQTLGKRLFGLRIVELTGKPLTPLRAFKRYGGYAAGMATGLFGFLQVLWDPNRQAIQDKTAHTVVIDLRRKLAAPELPRSPAEEPR